MDENNKDTVPAPPVVDPINDSLCDLNEIMDSYEQYFYSSSDIHLSELLTTLYTICQKYDMCK